MDDFNVNGKIDVNVNSKYDDRTNSKDGWSIKKEIEEHRKDCAVNRAVHFKAHQKYYTIYKRIKFINCIIVLIAVAALMLYSEVSDLDTNESNKSSNNITNNVTISSSFDDDYIRTNNYNNYDNGNNSNKNKYIIVFVWLILGISLGISIFGMVYDFESKSRENWQAAQSYQALYRDCQFYDYEKDSQCEYAVAERIRKHLNNLNMISPSVSSKDYKEVNSGM